MVLTMKMNKWFETLPLSLLYHSLVSEFSKKKCKFVTFWFGLIAFEFDKLALFVGFANVLRHQRQINVESLFLSFHSQTLYIYTPFTLSSREYWHLRCGNRSKDFNGFIGSHFHSCLQKKVFFGAAKKAGTINKFNHKKQNKMNSDFTPTTQCDVNVILLNFLWCDPFLFLTRCHRLRILTPKNVKAIPSDRLTFAYHFVPLIWNFSFF